MKKAHSRSLTTTEAHELAALGKLPDTQIDTSDAPELRDWAGAQRGLFYRTVKQQVTLRLDADVVAWFRRHATKGEGYQTRINRALREYIRTEAGTTNTIVRNSLALPADLNRGCEIGATVYGVFEGPQPQTNDIVNRYHTSRTTNLNLNAKTFAYYGFTASGIAGGTFSSGSAIFSTSPMIFPAPPHATQLHALSRANAEIGRLNTLVAAQAELLADQSKEIEALQGQVGGFQAPQSPAVANPQSQGVDLFSHAA